jgi:phospholipase/carboxylesterase
MSGTDRLLAPVRAHPVITVVLVAAVLWAVWRYGFGTRLSYERVGLKPAAGVTTLIVLHGHGAPGDDLVPLAKELTDDLGAAAFVIAGPESHGGGRSWVPDLKAPTMEAYLVEIEKHVSTTARDIWEVVGRARKQGVSCDDLVFVGFSLGGRFAMEAALRGPSDCRPRAIVAFAPGGGAEIPLPTATGTSPPRVLITMGKADDVVSPKVAGRWGEHLVAAGSDVQWLDVAGGHTITPEARKAALAFLRGEVVGTPLSVAD